MLVTLVTRAPLMGVSAEEFARLENEDPEFRAMLEEAKATAALSFDEQLDRADELLLDALMSFLEGGDLRAFMRAPTILRYLRRRQAPSPVRESGGGSRASNHDVRGRTPERPRPVSEGEPDPAWAGPVTDDADDRPDWREAGPTDESRSAIADCVDGPDVSLAPDASTANAASLIPALRGVFGEGELERSLAEIAATERRMAQPQSASDLTEADWAQARDTLASAPAAPASAAEAAMAEERDALVARIDRLLAEPVPVEADDVDLADAIVMTAWGRPWIYQGPTDTWRVQRHIEKLRAEHRMAHPDRVTRLGSAEFREAAEALAAQARPP